MPQAGEKCPEPGPRRLAAGEGIAEGAEERARLAGAPGIPRLELDAQPGSLRPHLDLAEEVALAHSGRPGDEERKGKPRLTESLEKALHSLDLLLPPHGGGGGRD